ncbi:MAG: hypothetical protein IJ609_01070 [Paludibacteraceae bacterium]|nr:hypothetical protein [Paludibacteraceae bacterium]
MKKIFTLSLVAVFAISAMAQHVSFRNSDARALTKTNSVVKHIDANRQLMTQDEYSAFKAAKKAQQATAAEELADTLQWIRPYGAFFANAMLPILITDTADITFIDASSLHVADSLYWGLFAENQLYQLSDSANQPYLDYLPAIGAESFQAEGEYYMPMLFTTDAEGYVNQTYSYGGGLAEYYQSMADAYPDYASYYSMLAQYAAEPAILTRPAEPMSITTCAMYTDTLIGDGSPIDDYMINGDPYGSYLYGTGFQFSATKTVDTLVVIFDNLSTLWTDSATLELYSDVEDMIPAGAEVKLEIVPAGMNQNYQWVIGDQVLASAVATQTDLYGKGQYQSGTYYAYLDFAFGAKNALGGFSPAPATIDGVFAVKIILNNAQGNNFGIMSDYYYPEGQSFYLVDGKLLGNYWSNMNLSLHAKFVDPQAQAVETVEGDAVKPVKEFRDGQVIIRKGDKLFNVMGVEL